MVAPSRQPAWGTRPSPSRLLQTPPPELSACTGVFPPGVLPCPLAVGPLPDPSMPRPRGHSRLQPSECAPALPGGC